LNLSIFFDMLHVFILSMACAENPVLHLLLFPPSQLLIFLASHLLPFSNPPAPYRVTIRSGSQVASCGNIMTKTRQMACNITNGYTER